LSINASHTNDLYTKRREKLALPLLAKVAVRSGDVMVANRRDTISRLVNAKAMPYEKLTA